MLNLLASLALALPLPVDAPTSAVPSSTGPIHRAAAPPADTTRDDLKVGWKGKDLPLDEVEGELGAKAAAAVTTWAPFAQEVECGMHLSADGRVLLLTRSERSKLSKELDLVEETIAFVDAMLPAAGEDGEATGESPTTGGTTPSGAPRMPDPTDDETVVLVQARDVKVYGKVLDRLKETEEYLGGWIPTARRLAGFVITKPLCASWIELLDGQEEWDIRNELVHRLTHLLVARRFGELPYWLQLGIAWHVEEDLLNGVYCFPYRTEFVYASEHNSWPADLAKMFRGKPDPFFGALVGWERGTYSGDKAREAFGFARFLALHHHDEFGPILRDLFDLRATKGVKGTAQSWKLIPGFEPSEEDQAAVFAKHLGDDFLDELVEYYRKGKRYKPARK
ncbi:MAG: hypothetical protein R3F34_00700 [Planctomycetota bacterium]